MGRKPVRTKIQRKDESLSNPTESLPSGILSLHEYLRSCHTSHSQMLIEVHRILQISLQLEPMTGFVPIWGELQTTTCAGDKILAAFQKKEKFKKSNIIAFGIIHFSLVSLIFPIFHQSNFLNINSQNILKILQQDYFAQFRSH